MNFTKMLVALFFIVIFVANVEGTGEVNLTCKQKCELLCLVNPFCMEDCMKGCHDGSISTKKVAPNVLKTN
ncbi:hypothetical protein R3W88_004985 [Solanum pinnatisectum]|uniref:Uncharacterized protein n=1 Tax=Solanum pinnatisectum TaxID=50273 RepID=A0AAV9KEE0_9SOLN|nr:hypothetical protein R3W88_004985 [Solanum pinnatisectum]